MSQRECEKHGLTDFTDPDMNNCVMCKLCRDEAFQKIMDETAPRTGLAKAMVSYIRSWQERYRIDNEPLATSPVFDKDPARKPND